MRRIRFRGNFRLLASSQIGFQLREKGADWSVIMPFYRILLVTRNDLAAASIYNKFVETAKYVINNGGVFQRIYNTGNQIFRCVL